MHQARRLLRAGNAETLRLSIVVAASLQRLTFSRTEIRSARRSRDPRRERGAHHLEVASGFTPDDGRQRAGATSEGRARHARQTLDAVSGASDSWIAGTSYSRLTTGHERTGFRAASSFNASCLSRAAATIAARRQRSSALHSVGAAGAARRCGDLSVITDSYLARTTNMHDAEG